MEIKGTAKAGTELDKRFYVPGVVIHDACPKCAQPWQRDLNTSYFSYPVTGEPIDVNAYCTLCEHEWVAGRVVVKIVVKAVP